jgi:hypothetical protein
MSFSEQIVHCPICGGSYALYASCAGDQSACPKCKKKARENEGGTYTTDKTSLENSK